MGIVDDFFDKAEGVVGMIENTFSRSWKMEEVTDAESGESVWLVTDGARKYETRSEEDAQWLVDALKVEKGK